MEIFESRYSMAVLAPDDQADSAERRFCCAMLRDAIEVATGVAPGKDDACYEAQRWLRARDDNWIFPCGSVCSLAGIDQEAMLKIVEPKFVRIRFERIKKKRWKNKGTIRSYAEV